MFVFLATNKCSLDSQTVEPTELRELQVLHIAQIRQADWRYMQFSSKEDLDRQIRAMRLDSLGLGDMAPRLAAILCVRLKYAATNSKQLAVTHVEASRKACRGMIRVFQTQSGKTLMSKDNPALAGRVVTFSPDGKYLLAGGYNGAVMTWTVPAFESAHNLPAQKSGFSQAPYLELPKPGDPKQGTLAVVSRLNFGPESQTLLRSVRSMKLSHGLETKWPTGDSVSSPYQLRLNPDAISPNGELAVYLRSNNVAEVQTYYPSDKLLSEPYGGPSQSRLNTPGTVVMPDEITCLALSNSRLVVSNKAGLVTMVNIDPSAFHRVASDSKGVSIGRQFRGHPGSIRSMALGHTGRWIATAGERSVSAWLNVPTGNELIDKSPPTVDTPGFSIHNLAGSTPRNQKVSNSNSSISATAKDDHVAALDRNRKPVDVPGPQKGIVRVLDSAGKELRTLKHPDYVSNMLFLPDGKRLLTVASGNLRIWDATTGQEQHLIKKPNPQVAISKDGKKIIAGTTPITVWEVLDDRVHEVASLGTAMYWRLSPDGTRLACLRKDSRIEIWDVAAARCLTTLPNSDRDVTYEFTEDHTRLVSKGSEQISFWCLTSGEDVLNLADSELELDSGTNFLTQIGPWERKLRAAVESR